MVVHTSTTKYPIIYLYWIYHFNHFLVQQINIWSSHLVRTWSSHIPWRMWNLYVCSVMANSIFNDSFRYLLNVLHMYIVDRSYKICDEKISPIIFPLSHLYDNFFDYLFRYHKVFDQLSSQKEIFETIAKPVVNR